MVSYKKKYLEALEQIKHLKKIEPLATNFDCPRCGEGELLVYLNEVVCSNEKCSFDKTINDLLRELYHFS